MNDRRWVMLLLIGAVCAAPAVALDGSDGVLNITVENDLFYGNDRHYTNGVRLIWVPGGDTAAPAWSLKLARLIPWFPRDGEVRHGYSFGQSMFVPSDISVADPPGDDRPYAGWLYGGIGLGVESGSQLDLLGLSVGVVGPAALAEQTQKLVHQLIDATEPRGWDTQLENEPGILLTYQHFWREYAATSLLGNRFDITPHVGATLGNVFTYANTGVTVRYGGRLPRDYGPPRIQPGLPGSPDFAPTGDFGWYLFAGVEGRAVARNIFLDGNSFRDSRSVDKRPLVGDLQFGLVFAWRDARVSYTHVIRSREFTTQDEHDEFGGLSLTLKF